MADYSNLEFTTGELELCESLLELQRKANAIPGHDWQAGTYGAIGAALVTAIAQAVRNAYAVEVTPAGQPIVGGYAPAKGIALAIVSACVENGESVEWQLNLLRDGTITPWAL